VDGINADCVAVKTVGNHVCITAINYTTGVITLSADPGTRSAGDPVWLYTDSNGTVQLYGSAPDIGAVEFNPAAPVPSGKPRLRLRIIRGDLALTLAIGPVWWRLKRSRWVDPR
jgi:hypothetical protein